MLSPLLLNPMLESLMDFDGDPGSSRAFYWPGFVISVILPSRWLYIRRFTSAKTERAFCGFI